MKEVVSDPWRFDGKKIRIRGIYSSAPDESLLFSDEAAFATNDATKAIFVFSQPSSFTENKSGYPEIGKYAVAEGYFTAVPVGVVKIYGGNLGAVNLLQRDKSGANPTASGR